MERIRLVLLALCTASLVAIPTTAHAEDRGRCKDGGWEGLVTTSGALFKNQGDCVSYVSAGGTLVVPCFPGDGSCWV